MFRLRTLCRKLLFIELALAILIGPPLAAESWAFPLRIIHVNDTHSHLEPVPLRVKIGVDTIYLKAGGYPRLLAKIEQVRSADPDANTLLLHAGDMVQGTLYFNAYKGRAGMKLMNLMGFDAMVVGNHEFDKGPALLADLIHLADFPILGANVDASKEELLRGLLKPYVIKEFNGRKVGVIGLVIQDIPTISSPGDKLVFNNVKKTAQEYISLLQSQGVDIIVLLTHQGYGRDLELAKSVSGIDIIVGGHSHTLLGDFESLGMKSAGPYPTTVKGPSGEPVLVVQDWEWAKTIGVLDLEFDPAGVITQYSGRPVMIVGDEFVRKDSDDKKVPVVGAALDELVLLIQNDPAIEIVPEDSKALAVLAEFKPGVDSLRVQKIAVIAEDLHNVRVPGAHAAGVVLPHGSEIAPLVADSMLFISEKYHLGLDAAIQNAGGVRRDLHAGDLTVADAYELMPFGNTMIVLRLSGREFKAALEHGVDRAEGAFPYVAGARYTADMNKPRGKRIISLEVKNRAGQWIAVKDEEKYKIGVNSFLANGGDGYEVFKKSASPYDTGFVDAEIFMEYAEAQKRLDRPSESGVTYISKTD